VERFRIVGCRKLFHESAVPSWQYSLLFWVRYLLASHQGCTCTVEIQQAASLAGLTSRGDFGSG